MIVFKTCFVSQKSIMYRIHDFFVAIPLGYVTHRDFRRAIAETVFFFCSKHQWWRPPTNLHQDSFPLCIVLVCNLKDHRISTCMHSVLNNQFLWLPENQKEFPQCIKMTFGRKNGKYGTDMYASDQIDLWWKRVTCHKW